MSFQPVFQWHSDTSIEAAQKIKPHLGKLQERVLNEIFFSFEDGRTDEELEIHLDLIGSTARPRRRELQLKGMIVDSGQRRITRSGRKAVVWITKK